MTARTTTDIFDVRKQSNGIHMYTFGLGGIG